MAFTWNSEQCRGICCRAASVFATCLLFTILLSSFSEPVSAVRMMTRQLNMTFEMGRDATLTCTVRNIGKKRVIWRKLADSFPLSVGTTKFWPSKKYRVKRDGEDWQLIIKNVQHTDAGEYECRLSGQDDIADVLALIIPGSDHTHMLPTETTVTTRLGSDVVLPCHVNNLRKALVLWQKDGRVLSLRKKAYSGDKRHKVLHTKRHEWSLQLRRVQEEDLGVYTCVVNTNPPLTRTVTLREGRPPKHPEGGGDKLPETGQSIGGSPQLVRETFRDEVEVKQYEAVTLTCQYTGDPKPSIKWERRIWSRDGIKITEDLKTLGEKYTLTNAQPEDTGVYVCKASNGVPPPEQAKIRLKVKEVMTTTTPKPTTTTFDPIYDVAPRVYSMEDVVYQRMGHDAELSCKGVGVPRPVIRWMKSGTLLQDDYKYGIRSQPYRHHTLHSTLLVRSVHPGNFAKYECVAFNKFGEDKTTIVLAELRRP